MRSLKLVVLGLIVVLSSCSGNSPEKTVKEFYLAIKGKDFTKAKALSTPESHATIDMLSSGLDINIGEGELTNVDCVTENETSLCDCFFEGSQKPFPISVTKLEGEWKVNVKETAKNMMNNLFDAFKDIDLNGLMDKVNLLGDSSSEKINDLIKKIDTEKVKETLSGLDSNMEEVGESIEDLLEQLEESSNKK